MSRFPSRAHAEKCWALMKRVIKGCRREKKLNLNDRKARITQETKDGKEEEEADEIVRVKEKRVNFNRIMERQ